MGSSWSIIIVNKKMTNFGRDLALFQTDSYDIIWSHHGYFRDKHHFPVAFPWHPCWVFGGGCCPGSWTQGTWCWRSSFGESLEEIHGNPPSKGNISQNHRNYRDSQCIPVPCFFQRLGQPWSRRIIGNAKQTIRGIPWICMVNGEILDWRTGHYFCRLVHYPKIPTVFVIPDDSPRCKPMIHWFNMVQCRLTGWQEQHAVFDDVRR